MGFQCCSGQKVEYHSFNLLKYFQRNTIIMQLPELGHTCSLQRTVTSRPLLSNIRSLCPSESAATKKLFAIKATSVGVLIACFIPVGDLGFFESCHCCCRLGGFGVGVVGESSPSPNDPKSMMLGNYNVMSNMLYILQKNYILFYKIFIQYSGLNQ